MTLEFTKDGLTIEDFTTIYDRVLQKLKDAYQIDIDIDPRTPDGQRIGITAKEVLDFESFMALLYSQLDPDFATGAFQDVIFKFTGITKFAARQSTADLTVTTDRSIALQTGYTVRDDNDQEWETISDYSLLSGPNTITVHAIDYGAIEAIIGAINGPVTIILGIQSVTNPAAATVGRDEETPAEARRRRNKSLENPAFSTLGALISKIASIDGVTDVEGYENDSDSYDAEKDMIAHSIWMIVNGGDVDKIARNMAIQKTGGTPDKGSTEGVYTETIDTFPERTKTIIHRINFDRPTDVPLYVRADALRKITGEPVDTDLIESKIQERDFFIADSLRASELYADGYQAGTNFVLSNMEISLNNIDWTDQDLFSGYGGLFSLDIANITVTETFP